MTRASSEQSRLLPWYAKAGAASSIIPLSRWVSPTIFALKNGGYGIAASVTGIDEESLTDQELEVRTRAIEGALRGLPEGACLYQYSRVLSGYEIPRKETYGDPVLESFVNDRLEYLNANAGFRRIDLFWCITFEPSETNPLNRKPKDAEADNTRRLAMLRKTASILETQLASVIGLRVLDKAEAFPLFAYLFNLEPWADHAKLKTDAGLDRQIVQSPVAIEGDHLRVGKRYVQMFSLMNTPEVSRPCQFAGLMTLDCDSVLCTTWRPKSAAKVRAEISQQEKFISFFKVGVFGRVMAGRDTASLEEGAGAKAANASVDDLSDVIRSLDKIGQGEFTMRLLLAAKSKEQLHETIPAVHRVFVDARAEVIEESLGNLSAFYTMFPGNGKTTTLEAIREGAEQGGYKVEGFAPTSKAAGQLREAGIEANTLQSFLARQKDSDPASKHLYMLDESSLASTQQMRAFLNKIRPEDRVLVIGDTRQHQGVDAGRPFQQMQEAGMQTSKLDTIMRQKDPELLRAVQHLATNETEKGIALLSEQGRVTELASAPERIAAIARDYAAKPENTIIVSPDNRSRQQINEAVRVELQKAGTLADDGKQYLTLSHRSDMTGPDRTWAAMYRPGDVVQYERGSKAEGIERNSFGVVRSNDVANNRVTVELSNGSSVEYDPRRVYGVNVYREVSREFATGDRLQFSALNKELGISNRDMGTITKIEADRLTVLMDGKEKRSVSFDPAAFRQFDHGYAVTSHSSQGLTADRVIANIDTDSSRSLINNRLAYVAISRASEDARIYTNNAETLGARLATDVTKTAALEFAAHIEQAASSPVKVAKPVAIHEYNNADSRLAAVAQEYVSRPERSVIVAPDRAEREELTQLIRADLYSQGKLGRDAQAVPVLIEKETGSKMRVESYQQGDKILYKTGSPSLDGIPNDSQATVVDMKPRGNVLTVKVDSTREEVSYNPAQLRTQTRESRIFQEETREIAEGERIRFTIYDKDMGVRSGDLGTVTQIGHDNSMSVKLDTGKTAEVSTEKARHIEYGYAVEGLKNIRAERVLATGEGLTHQQLQSASSPRADIALYTSPAQQDFSPAKEIATPELAQPVKQHDFGIGF